MSGASDYILVRMPTWTALFEKAGARRAQEYKEWMDALKAEEAKKERENAVIQATCEHGYLLAVPNPPRTYCADCGAEL